MALQQLLRNENGPVNDTLLEKLIALTVIQAADYLIITPKSHYWPISSEPTIREQISEEGILVLTKTPAFLFLINLESEIKLQQNNSSDQLMQTLRDKVVPDALMNQWSIFDGLYAPEEIPILVLNNQSKIICSSLNETSDL